MRAKKKTTSAAPAGAGAVSRQRAAAKPRLNADSLDTSVGYSLRRAQLSTHDEFTAALAPFDIRPSQFAVLMLIQANPGLTQAAICSALGIQKTNFVALLDKLEGRGITERRKAGGDRRSSALHLTPAGEAFVNSIESAHKAMEKSLARRLGPKRTRELLAVLHEFTMKAHSTRS